MRNGTSQSPFRTRSSTAHCAPAVPVTGTTSQHRFARCDSVASSRDDSTPRSDARFVSPLALTHVGYTVSPRGFRGLTASAFSLPWRSASELACQVQLRHALTVQYELGIPEQMKPGCSHYGNMIIYLRASYSKKDVAGVLGETRLCRCGTAA